MKKQAILNLLPESVYLYNWLPFYIIDKLYPRINSHLTKHIMIAIVDHFEPFTGRADKETATHRVATWRNKYPQIASKHFDSDKIHPQHTWFYPPHLDHSFLEDLLYLSKQGYGEIEMHLHHNHMEPFPDSAESLRAKIIRCIDDYSKYGIFRLPDGRKKFAFIHGDWSLSNSRGADFCGVNDEIKILKKCGCYADFTFPSLGKAQPSLINRIYYAQSNINKPKSYNWGKEIRVGGSPCGDLLIVPGVLGLRWNSRTHRFRPSIEASNIDKADYPFSTRIDYWIRNGVTIKGRSDWIFVKLHTHGAHEGSWDSLIGEKANEMFNYLEEEYNDGENYVLHYVTAREMYNIIKAAEIGKDGNPSLYRDFEIPKYIYLNSRGKE